jgi:glycerol-3-phosphate dehydrogenase
MAYPLPSPSWCAEHEFCCSLEDYLRRRTNIAQWVTRGGIGRADEHLGVIEDLGHQLFGNRVSAVSAVESYRKRVAVEFDAVIAAA